MNKELLEEIALTIVLKGSNSKSGVVERLFYGEGAGWVV